MWCPPTSSHERFRRREIKNVAGFGPLPDVRVAGPDTRPRFAVRRGGVWISGCVRQQEKQRWNAARPYRLVGAACAGLGTVLWTIVLIIAVFRLIMSAEGLG